MNVDVRITEKANGFCVEHGLQFAAGRCPRCWQERRDEVECLEKSINEMANKEG